MVVSVYHNETARITQVCWNGERNPITFRQSRLVNIASQSFDTPEIFLLLRWMSCIPLCKPKVARRRLGTGRPAAALKPHLPTTIMRNDSAELSNRVDSPTIVTEELPRHIEPHPARDGEVPGLDSTFESTGALLPNTDA
jgi:hypothetical protein